MGHLSACVDIQLCMWGVKSAMFKAGRRCLFWWKLSFQNPVVKLRFILSLIAKRKQLNFHQIPSLNSEIQKKLYSALHLNSHSAWKQELGIQTALWMCADSVRYLLNYPYWENCHCCPPISAQSYSRFTVPNDGEWWAIDQAQAAVTYTGAQYSAENILLNHSDKPHQIIET